MLTDVHAHYDDKRFNSDRDKVIEKIRKAGVARVINCGADLASSKVSVGLAEKYGFMYAAVGVHPHYVKDTPPDTAEILDGLVKNKKVCALGEFGLDFFRNLSDGETQRLWFDKQMEFAADLNRLPVVIHSRDAHDETFKTAKRFAGRVRGIFHCYAGSAEMARELIKIGYKFSIGGVCTFKNARVCVEFLRETPLKHIMLETDCPYLAPDPYRGERNDSSFLPLIAERIAEIKGIKAEEVIRVTGQNAAEMFGI